MEPPKGWCQTPVAPLFQSISSPIVIPSCEAIDESNIPPFLRDDVDMGDFANDKDWRGKYDFKMTIYLLISIN